MNLVKENLLQKKDIDYTVILYNQSKVSSTDKYAIDKYASSLFDGKSGCALIDTSGYRTAAEIYGALKETARKNKGKIKGPAFRELLHFNAVDISQRKQSEKRQSGP